jgi:hypothetical protein
MYFWLYLFSSSDTRFRSALLPLSDHLATLVEYLNHYQSEIQGGNADQSGGKSADGMDSENSKWDKAADLEEHFGTYLISTCYPKIHRRLLHPLSIKLISIFSSIERQRLTDILDEVSFPISMRSKSSNLLLCRVIHSALDTHDLRGMIRELKGGDQEHSAFFQSVTETYELFQKGTNESSQFPLLYRKDTFEDFHYFVLLALTKYRSAISTFYDKIKAGCLNTTDRLDLTVYSFLLWRLAHSSILCQHLIFLRATSLIPQDAVFNHLVPEQPPLKPQDIVVNRPSPKYAMFPHLALEHEVNDREELSLEGDEGEDLSLEGDEGQDLSLGGYEGEDLSFRGAEVNEGEDLSFRGDEVNEGEDLSLDQAIEGGSVIIEGGRDAIEGLGGHETGEDESSEETGLKEEMDTLEYHSGHRKDPTLMIQRWMCLLVSHLQSLHILSSFAASRPGEIRVQHVAVKRATHKTPQDWTAVLKRALPHSLPEGDTGFSEMEKIILGQINKVNATPGRHGIFSYFKGEFIIRLAGHIHCEAALAAVLHSPPNGQRLFDVRFIFFSSFFCHLMSYAGQ